MRRSRFKKRGKQQNQDVSLKITSMADIFTVILVFMIKTFTTGSVNLTPPKGMKLPEAEVSQAHDEGLKVQILNDTIMVRDEAVAKLQNFQFARADLNNKGISAKLSKILKREKRRQMIIAEATNAVKVDPKIIIVADQKTPYKTLKTVLASAATTGFTDYKLAVIRTEK